MLLLLVDLLFIYHLGLRSMLTKGAGSNLVVFRLYIYYVSVQTWL